MKFQPQRATARFPAAGAVLLIVTGCLFAFMHARPVEYFSRIADGMTEAEVRQTIGEPLGIRHDSSAETVFYYGGFRRARWCTMEVHFGGDGHVTGKFHDH